MPYARTDYTLADVKLMFRDVNVNLIQGAQEDWSGVFRPGSKFGKPSKKMFGEQPQPHAGIHGGDELHAHPLFAYARISTGGAKVHSVMDETEMQAALVNVFNDANMQPWLQKLDGGEKSVGVNVNFGQSPGSAHVFDAAKSRTANLSGGKQAVVGFFLKVMPDPTNSHVPILQTCVPHTTPLQTTTKKGASLGFTV